jgi:hypothetical protein
MKTSQKPGILTSVLTRSVFNDCVKHNKKLKIDGYYNKGGFSLAIKGIFYPEMLKDCFLGEIAALRKTRTKKYIYLSDILNIECTILEHKAPVYTVRRNKTLGKIAGHDGGLYLIQWQDGLFEWVSKENVDII